MQNSQENTFGAASFIILKKTLANVFSCKYCESFRWFQCTVYIEGEFYIEEIYIFPFCVALTYFVGETARVSSQNAQKRFSKARRNIKKLDVSVTSSQDSREAAGNFESYDFLTWLTSFITFRETKCDVRIFLS